MEVHVVARVGDPLEDLTLFLGRVRAKDLESDVRVRRKHDIVKCLHFASGRRHLDTGPGAHNACNSRTFPGILELVGDSLDVAAASILHDAPLGADQDVEEVVVDPEPNENLV